MDKATSFLATKDIYKELKESFYIKIPFTLEKNTINEAMQAFFRFLDEPADIKNHINFSISDKHRRGDVGFKHRDPGEDIYNDSKDFFHFHPAIFLNYTDFLEKQPVVRDFLQKAKPIWEHAYKIIHNIVKILDEKYPGTLDKVFAADSPHILLRFLRYNWQQSGKYLAKPHFDAGSFTLAIAESSPGLRIGSGPDDLKLIEHEEEKAIFMMGSNFKAIMPISDLFASWHDVVQLDENLIGKPCARWALVVFVDGHDVEALSRLETHKYYMPSSY